MKRLSKVLFALAVILLIALPLSAAKSMNVTWSWLLNDPYVTSYRYQLDGESEDGWTVVDGTTSSYQATGLDPYKDYTLYLQCTYDGKIWSDSATSTAYALLQVEEIVEDLPVVEEVAPVEAETASFTLFGYTVENSWLDGVFTSTLKEKGIVTEDDVRGFALSEVEKYGEMLTSSATISFISDGFTLTYPETVDPADYIDVYKADLDAYITSLFTSEEAPVEETESVVEEAEVPPAPEKAEAIDVPEPISEVEVKLSPKAEKVSSFSFRLGIDGGVEMGINEVDPYSTIFPRLNISLDFRNILSFGKLGFGTRFDIGSVFKPLDGTFIGHDFNYFLNGNNWAMDATVDAKLMAYLNLGKFDFYLGGGIGYSIGSHNLYNRTHSGENTVFGFDTALVATGVVGLEWNITDSFSLALEGYYRNFFQSEAKAQSFAASLVMGFRF